MPNVICRIYQCRAVIDPTASIPTLSGMQVCQACATSYAQACAECETVEYRPYMMFAPDTTNRINGNLICGRCHDRYPYCDWCEETFRPTEANMAAHEDCGPGEKIHDDGYKPFRFVMHGRGKLHMGFELEIPCRDNVGTVLNEHFQDDEASIYAKTDGSVCDGYELVTQPRTLASYQSWDWTWLDKIVKDAGAKNPDDGDANHGLHVHLSKAGFQTPQHMGRFYLFFRRESNQTFIEHMAGRPGNEWADFYSMSCVSFNDVVADRCRGRRYAVLNMYNPDTIEFRLGCATVDKVKILGLLEFLHCVVHYSKKLEGEHEKSWQELLAWVKRGSRRKQTYANFLAMASEFEASQLVNA